MSRTLIVALSLLMIGGMGSVAGAEDIAEEALLAPTTEAGSIVTERHIAALGATELRLSNGMWVCLKPTESYDDEVLVQLAANGGSLAFPEGQRASAKFAGTIARESGVGKLSSSELTNLLFKYSVDLSIRTRLHYRVISGNCPVTDIRILLGVLHHFFAAPRYERAGLSRVVENTRDALQHRQRDCDSVFEDIFTAVNSQSHQALAPIHKSELQEVNFEQARTIFDQSFSSPEEFTCVIVGRFDTEEVKSLVLRYLATIPKKEPAGVWPGKPLEAPFPPNVTTKEAYCGRDRESLTRLTFPLSLAVDATTIQELDFASQVIETRLRNIVRHQLGTTHAVDVGYQFPHYPQLRPVWLTLQFRSPSKLIDPILTIVLQELERLQQQGPTEEEVQSVKVLLARMDKFWRKENSFWLQTFSNYYLWGWDPSHITTGQQYVKGLDVAAMRHFLADSFPRDNYTVVTMHIATGNPR